MVIVLVFKIKFGDPYFPSMDLGASINSRFVSAKKPTSVTFNLVKSWKLEKRVTLTKFKPPCIESYITHRQSTWQLFGLQLANAISDA